MGGSTRRRSVQAAIEVLEDRRLLSGSVGGTGGMGALIFVPIGFTTVGSVSSAQVTSVPIDATVGATFDGDVAQITGLTPGNKYALVATIKWGDGTGTSLGSLSRDAKAVYHVVGRHIYSDPGTYDVTVNVDARPLRPLLPVPVTPTASTPTVSAKAIPTPSPTVHVGTVHDTATVAPGAATGVALQLTAGVPFRGSVGSFAYAGNVTSPAASVAIISWGDGTYSRGKVVADTASGAGHYIVNGSHTYRITGSYSIATTVTTGSIFRTGVIARVFSTATVTSRSGPGPATITVVNGILTVIGTAGDDNIGIRQSSPAITDPPTPGQNVFLVTINSQTTTVPADGITGVWVNGAAGNDTIDLGGLTHYHGNTPTPTPPGVHLPTPVTVNAVLHGGGGTDTLIGGDGTDQLYSDGGNDTLYATDGGDSAYGGAPGDTTAINLFGVPFAYIDPSVNHIITEEPLAVAPPPAPPPAPIPAPAGSGGMAGSTGTASSPVVTSGLVKRVSGVIW